MLNRASQAPRSPRGILFGEEKLRRAASWVEFKIGFSAGEFRCRNASWESEVLVVDDAMLVEVRGAVCLSMVGLSSDGVEND